MTPQADKLDDILEWQYEEGVDFWKAGAAGRLSRVMIPPHLQTPFEDFLNTNEIDHKIHIEDFAEVDRIFEADQIRRIEMKKVKSAIEPSASPDFSVYWTTEEIDMYCRRLATMYPQLVQREVIATSFEGREVFALKISRGGFGNKPIFFMDGEQSVVSYQIHFRIVSISS